MITSDRPAVHTIRPFVTQADIDQVRKQYPTAVIAVGAGKTARREQFRVDRYGLIFPGRRLLSRQPSEFGEPPEAEEIALVLDLIKSARLIRTRTPAFSSYKLKHSFERVLGRYISNGAAIVALSRATIRQTPQGLNTMVCVSRPWVRTLDAQSWGAFNHV